MSTTPGAIRAARRINNDTQCSPEDYTLDLARIIDSETHAKELLVTCQDLLKACSALQTAYLGSNGYQYPYYSDATEKVARDLIKIVT